jgi:hypothetical protein
MHLHCLEACLCERTLSFMRRFSFLTFSLLLLTVVCQLPAAAQTPEAPLTNEEFVRLLRQLPERPDLRQELIETVRRRGISFPLTSGLRSLVATKSGNDADLRRILEEAERRRLNPTAASLPAAADARELLAQARVATREAAEAMPDFVVRQEIVRSVAQGTTQNWKVADRLTIAVSFRASEGEQYRVLAVNGAPVAPEVAREGSSYAGFRGATSTGEYVSRLAGLFREESRTEFEPIDTDTLRDRRTIVYRYKIKKENSRSVVSYGSGSEEQAVVAGARGRVWIDRETFRVLRLEQISTELPRDFPVMATTNLIDYDWVTIAERRYLLPVRAIVMMTASMPSGIFETRNDVRFRNYQKYGTEVKIIEEEIEDEDAPPEKKP